MNVAKLNEMDDLKSNEMKAKWRSFCEEFKHVEDYSFATLVRLDSRYETTNTTGICEIEITEIYSHQQKFRQISYLRKFSHVTVLPEFSKPF